MEYRGTWIRQVSWQGTDYYRAEYKRGNSSLKYYAATHNDPVGIMRAVDDWISTGRSQFRAAA